MSLRALRLFQPFPFQPNTPPDLNRGLGNIKTNMRPKHICKAPTISFHQMKTQKFRGLTNKEAAEPEFAPRPSKVHYMTTLSLQISWTLKQQLCPKKNRKTPKLWLLLSRVQFLLAISGCFFVLWLCFPSSSFSHQNGNAPVPIIVLISTLGQRTFPRKTDPPPHRLKRLDKPDSWSESPDL